MKKLLSVILAVMMVMSVIPVGANTGMATGGAGGNDATFPIIPEGATLIFAEDFESGFDIDTNLLEADGTAEFEKNGKKTIAISQPAGTAVPDGYVAKVLPVDGFTGNALYLESSVQPAKADGTANDNTTDNNLKFELFFDGGNAIDTQTESSPYYGKQLVYEFDAKTSDLRQRQFMKLFSSDQYYPTFQKASGSKWEIRQGEWAKGGGLWHIESSIAMASKTSFKVVFNQNGEVDTVRTYGNGVLGIVDWVNNDKVQGSNFNGKIVKDFVGEKYAGAATVNMDPTKGLLTYVCPTASKTAKVYIDNIVVYAVDPIEFDGFEKETNVNPEEGLVVKFTEKFNATKDTFKVKTMAGVEVNAITDVTMASDKMSATIKMDFGRLDARTKYQLWIDDEFESEAGAVFYANPLGINAENDWVYLSEFETCPKLEVVITPALGNITNYDLGDDQVITLAFNEPLAETVDFANAFVVTDEDGNEIDGLFAALNLDRTEGSLDLSGLQLGNGEHTIRAKDGALYTSAGVKASIAYTFGTANFTATVNPTSIPQYVAGTRDNNKIAVTLGAATALTNDNIITAFDVTNEAGEYVNGLVATLEPDGKFITLDIQEMDLAPGKYLIKSNEKLVDKRGRQLESPAAVSFKVVEELSTAQLLFEEDFEGGYTVGENWLTGATVSVNGTNGGKWEITGGTGHANNFMGVVTKDDVVDKNGAKVNFFNSNVLKVTAGNEAGFSFWRRPETNIDLAAQGKFLVYEFDFYVNNGYKERKFMAIDPGNANGFQKLANANLYTSTGPYYQAGHATYGDPLNGNWYARNTATISGKHTMKVVVDQTKAVDSIRTYLDGEVQSANYQAVDNTYSNFGKVAYDFYGEGYVGASTLNYGPFEGFHTAIGYSAGTTLYIDNLKAYAVNALEFVDVDWGTTSSDAFVPSTGFTLNFNENIDANELKNNLIVKDATGKAIPGAVRSAERTNGGKSALVKFDFAKLEKLSDYTVELSFLFASKDGAYIARDGVIDGGNVAIASFTTSDKLEVTVDKTAISNYDIGKDQEINITLSSALKAGVDVNDIFLVKDENGKEIEGLIATISDDRLSIKLQLSGLQLGDGLHTIESKENALVNEAGIAGSVFITVNTVDFVGVASPTTGTIKNYVQGAEQLVAVTLTSATTLPAGDVSAYFDIKDAAGNTVSGLKATLAENKMAINLDLSGLVLGVGDHTIVAKAGIVDARGRELAFDAYNFSVMPFIASYTDTVSEYVPGTDGTIEIKLTYPLSDSSVANIANAFVVKNKYDSAVSGLVVTVSEDKKVVTLNLKTLDIEGGEYAISSKAGSLVNAKGEILDSVAIALSTTAAASDDVLVDAGVGPNAGTEMTGDFVSTVLLSENFDSEDYTRDLNWLTNDSFAPAKFKITKMGAESDFVDSYVSVVEDPVNPGNYVLKNVAGYKDATDSVIAGKANYHIVKRELETTVATVPVDAHSIIKMYTKVFIPDGGAAGMPTGDNGVPAGDTKDDVALIALTNAGTTNINHVNLRKSGGVAQYNSYINGSDTASGATGSVSAILKSGEWNTVELIFGVNPKEDGTMFSSYEVIVNNQKIEERGGFYKAADFSTIGGMMSKLVTASGGSGTTAVLYDDWSIIQATRFQTHINVAKDEVPENQQIKLQLTSKLTDDSVALIEEKDLVSFKDAEGNDIDATIAIDNTGDNTKIVITPAYGLKYQTGYAVEIAENFVNDKGIVTPIKSVDDQTFGGFAYSFETAKAVGNTIDLDNGALSYDADYMHNENTFNYTMALKEAVDATETPNGIIGAVATFSETNELLGIQYKEFSAGEASKAFTVSSDLGTKYLRLYIWERNADGTMGKLMQIPDEVTSR